MEGVDQVLVVLQPVAGDDGRAAAADAAVVGLEHLALVQHLQAFIARQQRLAVRRAQVGPDQAVTLFQWIPGLAHLAAAAFALLRLAGLVQAMALHIEQPAVVAASDALRFHLAVVQRGAAVHAVRHHQAWPALPVAEQDQVFAQHAQLLRRGTGVGGQADGVPVAAHQLAHGRAGADFGQVLVVRGRGPAVGGAGVGRRALVGLDGDDARGHSAVTPAALMSSAMRG